MSVFRFDNFCERWASAYKSLSHIPDRESKNKRFFRHDSIDELSAAEAKARGVEMATDFIAFMVHCADPSAKFIAAKIHLYRSKVLEASATTLEMEELFVFALFVG